MPIEINELRIRVSVGTDRAEADATAAPLAGPAREALVAECVEQVLAVLRAREER